MNMKETGERDLLRTVFDALPSIVFVVDHDVRIQEWNAAASDILTAGSNTILKRRSGDVFHCVHSREVPEGCGTAPFCKECIIRDSVTEAFRGTRIVRRRTRMELLRDGNRTVMYALITASPFSFEERPLVLLVIEDISEIAELQRLIPICACCHKVRDDKESWMKVETYFKKSWDVDFTHGLCPDCFKSEMEKIDTLPKGVNRAPAGADTPAAGDRK